MKAIISRSEINGKMNAPPSKSYTIRSLMCAALADGESRLINPLFSDDTEAASEVLAQIGIEIEKRENWWQIRGGHLHEPTMDLFCRDSAATFRFMTAISSLIPGRCRLVPGASLARRPIFPLLKALSQLGIENRTKNATIIIHGGILRNNLVRLPGNISSQFISALLLIAPLAETGITIRLTTPPSSKPYLIMTLDCLKKFGILVETSDDLMQFRVSKQDYKPTLYTIEGDWSSASFLLALGAVSGQVEVTNLNRHSFQGDSIMVNLLRAMGAKVVMGKKSFIVQKSKLKALTSDLNDCIDLLPILAVLAAVAEGESRFSGISRARLKESNRVLALREGLEKMRVPVREYEDMLVIKGAQPVGTVIDSFGDHRIAMAFGILGSIVGNTTIKGIECVTKTYPDFWRVFQNFGGKVNIGVK
jgi:3-phosphoshikimate 1-carboxyvinyltransferase